ncbi:Fc.00g114040.m01.CDS01 [Cosmosporella sp. VM-42]
MAHAALLLAVTLVIAAPTTTWPFDWKPSSKNFKTCDEATFAPVLNVIPADWRDCASLSSEWSAQNGTFVIYPAVDDSFIKILKADSCTLAIKSSVKGEGPFTVGDVDINHILAGALLNYSDGSLLSAQGNVSCSVEGGEKKSLHWQIFDSGT